MITKGKEQGIPDLAKLLKRFGRNMSAQFNCHRVGRITAFDSDKLTCKVQLLDKFIFNDTEQDFTEFCDMPLLIYATENAGLTLGNIVGSECLVHFNDTDIDNWLQTGEAYAPNSLRQHDFNDGFVELRPYDHLSAEKITYDNDALVLYNGASKVRILNNGNIEITNGTAKIEMSGGNVSITGDLSVSGTITAGTDVETNGISLKGHKHSGVTTGGSNTGTPV